MEVDILVLGSATFSHLPLSQAPFITRQPWERKREESVYVWNTNITENCGHQGLLNIERGCTFLYSLTDTHLTFSFISFPRMSLSQFCFLSPSDWGLCSSEPTWVVGKVQQSFPTTSAFQRSSDTLSYSHFKDPVFDPGFILIVNACSQSNRRVLCPCPRICVSCSVWTALCFTPAQVNVSLRLNMPKTLCKCLSALIVWVKYTPGSQLQLITLWTPSMINYIWSH